VQIPASSFAARLGTTTADLQQAKHTVFFLELSHAHTVGPSRRAALVANVFSGPSGTTPANVIWVWGGYGERCFVPRGDGSWAQFTVGLQAVSQRGSQPWE
jgi:hypothetical protein